MKGKYVFASMYDRKAVQDSNALGLHHGCIGASAATCAGGNRVAVGPRGTVSAEGILTLKDSVGQKLAWDDPIGYIDKISLSWVSDADLKSVLERLLFDITDVTDGLEELLFSDDINFEKVRTFFANDYLRCRSLYAELEYRLDKL